MTIQVGRLGLDVTHGEPFKLSQDEDRLHLSGGLTTEAANASVMNQFRQNVLGLGEMIDEPIVPIIDTTDDQLGGFYRVLGTSIDFEDGDWGKNRFRWDMEFERIPDYALPAMESVLIGGFRTNSHTITPVPIHWVPSTVVNYYNTISSGVTDFNRTRGLSSGTLKGLNQSGSTSAAARKLASFSLSPANYYTGAARIEIQYANSTYYRTIGRKIWSNQSAVVWRLTNDLIRITASSTAGRIDISCWDGSAWDTAKAFKFGTTYAGSDIDRFGTFSIIRNAPEEVIARISMGDNITGTAAAIHRLNLDISLRRGSMMAECHWTADDAVLGSVGVSAAEAATAITGGIRATSNDAAGNRFVMYTPSAKSNDLVNGTFTKTAAATSWPFALGLERGGSGAATDFTVAAMSNDYFGAYTEAQTIVGR